MIAADAPGAFEDISDSAPGDNVNTPGTLLQHHTRAMLNEECSSQASLPSAPVSAAVSAAASTADLHAQDLDNLDGDGSVDHAAQDNANPHGHNSSSHSWVENGEVLAAQDEPNSKRSRHE